MSVSVSSKKKTILFVDGNQECLDSLRRSFFSQRKHWDLVFATKISVASDFIENNRVDFLIIDIKIHLEDGLAFLKSLKENHPNIFRIVFSGQVLRKMNFELLELANQFFAKPCSPIQIKNALINLIFLSDKIKDRELFVKLINIKKLPNFAKNYDQIQSTIESSNASIGQIAEMLSRDSDLSVKLLRLANSSFFVSNFGKVTDLESAIKIVGTNPLSELVLFANMYFDDELIVSSPLNLESEIHSTLEIANTNKQIAKKMQLSPDECRSSFLSGAVLTIGRLVLSTFYKDLFKTKFKEAFTEAPEVERAHFGASQDLVSALLLEMWGIPKTLWEGILHWGEPELWPEESTHLKTLFISVYIALQKRRPVPKWLQERARIFDLIDDIKKFAGSINSCSRN